MTTPAFLSNKHALKEQVQHLLAVIIGVYSLPCTGTQQLSNNGLQVGIFPAIRDPLVVPLLSVGNRMNQELHPFSSSFPPRISHGGNLWRSYETPSLLEMWVFERIQCNHFRECMVCVFRKINIDIKPRHAVGGVQIRMEILRLVFVSGFAILVNRLQGSQSNKTCEVWSIDRGWW